MTDYASFLGTPTSEETLPDGVRRRVWLVNDDETCTHVEIWMPHEAMQLFFSAKGCIDLKRYYNGTTPEAPKDKFGGTEPDCMHICDLPEFIDDLARAAELAKGHWHPI